VGGEFKTLAYALQMLRKFPSFGGVPGGRGGFTPADRADARYEFNRKILLSLA